MDNEFIDIPGYEGLYAVNRLGEVKSLTRYKSNNHIVNERILKQVDDNNGYKLVCLHKNLKRKNNKIHQLVAITFIYEYNSKYYQIDHINRDRKDNRLINLRIVSIRDNSNNLTMQSKYGCGVRKTKYNKFQAQIQINEKYVHIGLFSSPEQASEKYLQVKSQIEEIEKITRYFSFKRTKINDEYQFEFFPNNI